MVLNDQHFIGCGFMLIIINFSEFSPALINLFCLRPKHTSTQWKATAKGIDVVRWCAIKRSEKSKFIHIYLSTNATRNIYSVTVSMAMVMRWRGAHLPHIVCIETCCSADTQAAAYYVPMIRDWNVQCEQWACVDCVSRIHLNKHHSMLQCEALSLSFCLSNRNVCAHLYTFWNSWRCVVRIAGDMRETVQSVNCKSTARVCVNTFSDRIDMHKRFVVALHIANFRCWLPSCGDGCWNPALKYSTCSFDENAENSTRHRRWDSLQFLQMQNVLNCTWFIAFTRLFIIWAWLILLVNRHLV